MTSKRARHVSGKGAVWHMSSEQATLAKMPKYNGYAYGYGAHGNAKYHRAKSKRAWKAQMQKEGASRGSFPLYAKKFAKALDPLVASGPMMPLEDTYGAMG